MCFRASLRGCLFLFLVRIRRVSRLRCAPGRTPQNGCISLAFDDTGTGLERPSQLTIILHIPPCIACINFIPYRVRDAAPAQQEHRMNFELARTQMLGQQLRAWDVLDDRVLRAFADTPREDFVPADYRDLAFADAEIPLGQGQTMLAPKVEGRILQALQVEPIDDVLVVGTGSGYLTACVAQLAKHVTSVDIFPDFATTAAPKLAARDIRNVELKTADALRLPYRAQFDAIAVTGSTPVLNDHFVSMLRPQGRLFIVVGRDPAMEAQLITLQPNGTTTTDSLFETVLAPLINSDRPEPFVL